MITDIFRDPVARAGAIATDDLLEGREDDGQRGVVLGCGVVGTDGLDVPERGVDSVVLGRLAAVGKPVRQHPAVHEPAERREDPARDLGASGRQRQAGQRDHRVAAPVAEPVVAGDDGHAGEIVRAGPAHHELVGGEHELADY